MSYLIKIEGLAEGKNPKIAETIRENTLTNANLQVHNTVDVSDKGEVGKTVYAVNLLEVDSKLGYNARFAVLNNTINKLCEEGGFPVDYGKVEKLLAFRNEKDARNFLGRYPNLKIFGEIEKVKEKRAEEKEQKENLTTYLNSNPQATLEEVRDAGHADALKLYRGGLGQVRAELGIKPETEEKEE